MLKHSPLTCHYPAKSSTCMQLRGKGLLPFGAIRQNLLAVGIDYLRFSMAADTAFITLCQVKQRCSILT